METAIQTTTGYPLLPVYQLLWDGRLMNGFGAQVIKHLMPFGSVVVPRQQVVKDIYTTPDQELRRNLLNEFEVEYIVIGQLEREKIQQYQ